MRSSRIFFGQFYYLSKDLANDVENWTMAKKYGFDFKDWKAGDKNSDGFSQLSWAGSYLCHFFIGLFTW